MKGKFIVVDGPEGAGKTTILTMLQDGIHAEGWSDHFFFTAEPRGSIRELIMSRQHTPEAELCLFMADRAEHLTLIRDVLAQGVHVICDRYVGSTYAHQGYARGLDPDVIVQMHGMLFGDHAPDCEIILDVPVEVGLARKRRGRDTNQFDFRSVEYHQLVREGFKHWARHQAVLISADQPLDAVFNQVLIQVLNTVGFKTEL